MTYLADIFNEPISGEWGEETEGEGTKVIRTTNFTNSGKLDLSKGIAFRSISDKKVAEKRLQYGDVIIEKSGGSPAQPVGRVVFFDIEQATWLCNNFTAVLRPKQEFHPRYCFYLMYCLHKCGAVLKYQNKTTGIINLKLNDYLKKTKVSPLPPLETQKKIAAVLDKAQELIDKRTEQIAKLDEFVQSVFLEMFGDVVVNDKCWPKIKLKDISKVKIGPFGSLLHVEDYVKGGIPLVNPSHIVKREISIDKDMTISIKKAMELDAYRMKSGDVVLGRRGEIGRCAVVKEPHDGFLCGTGSMFISPTEVLHPVYLLYLLSSKAMRAILEHNSKGITMKNLNAGVVENIDLTLPPLDLQNQFAGIVEKTEQQKALMQQSLTEMENNMSSLMQRAFKGELF